ncbi:MAG: PAS domain-containing sensor histidine kinase [Gemmatimonadaceae bacterium]
MPSTLAKLRYIVGAGVLSLVVVAGIAFVATGRMVDAGADDQSLRLTQGLVALLMVLALVLAWFAYASLHDDLRRRAEAEAALRASEAKFSGILEIAADAIISVDSRQRIVHFNRGAEQIFGWSAADALGKELAFLLPSRHRGVHAQHVAGFGRSSESSRVMGERRVISGLRRDGSEFPAEASISKLALASGEHLYTVLLRDITERRLHEAAQERLTRAVAMLGETLEVDATERSIVHLALPWLADGALLDVVTGTHQLRRVPAQVADAGLTAALTALAAAPLDMDSPSRVVDVLLRGEPEYVPEVSDEWLEAHSSDRDEFERMRALGMRTVLLLPLVAREHVLGVLKLFRVAGGEPFSEAERAVAREVALRAAFALDNARLYEQARQATIARDHALGVVSHDLRNPISAIGMCARALLAATAADDTERRGLVTTIVDSTELTQRMIRDLLDVASIEVGRLAVERRTVAVAPLLERAMALFRREADDRGVALRVQHEADLPEATGDEERLVQVLSNLLGNALRFSDRGDEVTLGARRVGRVLEIAVRDTGAGIPPSELPRIFERYWTVRRSTPKGGTGLGLAIARGIVEAHGGRLWAESVLGQGSTFRFTVPVA